ncbi:MAG: RidA family protein [Chloroflexota bacterium]
MACNIEHINPQQLHHNPAFTNVVRVSGNATTVYIGGQNAVNAQGEVVGVGNLHAQAEQAFENLQIALASAGAKLEHVVKWHIYVVQGQPGHTGFQVFRRVWGTRPNPPAITMNYVAGLAHPDFLIEIDATAVIPE